MAAWRFGIFVCILMCLCLDLAASINDEGRALMRFKDEVEFDTYGALSDWKAEGSANPCLWFGVHCSRGKVTALSLSNLGLKGKLAAEIGQLIHLKSLNKIFAEPGGVGLGTQQSEQPTSIRT